MSELDRAMRAAGWKRDLEDLYERPAPQPFEWRVQFWVEEDVVQALLSVSCAPADQTLMDLGEDDAVAAVTRDPLGDGLTDVDAVVREIGAGVERMREYTEVDAFLAEVAREPETSEHAAVVAAAVLAAAGRNGEARERARQAPGDFAERFGRWLAGERPPPPPGFDEPFPWRDALKDAVRKARERRAEPPEVRAARPQASWGDVARTGKTLARLFRGELPPASPLPDRDREWTPVALAPDAAPALERARAASDVQILQGAFVEARLEPEETGRARVLVDGAEVGTVAATAPATVVGRIHRHRPGAPLELSLQL